MYTHEVIFDITFTQGNLVGVKMSDYLMCKFTSKLDATRYVDGIFLNIAKGKLPYEVTRAVIQEIQND